VIFNPDGLRRSRQRRPGGGAVPARGRWTDADTFTIITKAGEVMPTITAREVSMAIGRAFGRRARCVESAGRDWSFQRLSRQPMGVIDG
jgi:hypothetical protein